MSYANWNNTAFYNADDIVIYNGEDYQALLPNYDVVPLGNPLTWNPIAPPGPGPSNQLAFVQATTDLSIVGGNTIDISPKLVYSGSSDPNTNALSVGNTNVSVPTVPLLTFSETTTGVLPRPIIQTLVDDPAPPPANPPAYRLIQADYIKNINETWRFFVDILAGSMSIVSEFVGVGLEGLQIRANPINLVGINGPNQVRITDSVNNVSGNLWVNPSGTLMWNSQQIGPLECGIAEIQNPADGVVIPTVTTLNKATTIISLSYVDNGDPRFVAPTNQLLFYRVQNANSFTINASAPPGVPNGKLIVAWSILRP